MAGKNASLPLRACFALSGRFTLAFKCCFQTGTSSLTLKRGGLEDSSSNYKNIPFRQMSVAEVREASAEVVTEALYQPSEFITV